MISKTLETKIDKKFESITDEFDYILNALIGCKSTIEEIQYLLYLKEDLNKEIEK